MTDHPDATDYRNKGERDAAYWRELCERRFGHGFHVPTEEEASGLRAELNALVALKDELVEWGPALLEALTMPADDERNAVIADKFRALLAKARGEV